jgi:RNA polymerase sigma factor (sigma-70 family)
VGATVLSRPQPALRLRLRPLQSLSDERLATLVECGDNDAFVTLYERYHEPLARYCRSIVRDGEDARDAVQNAMLSALRAMQSHAPTGLVRPWLYKIAHNASIDVIRRRRENEELTDETPDRASDIQDVEIRERVRELFTDLRGLTEAQRSALVMREVGGLDYPEIGTALRTSAVAARKAVYEARVSLADIEAGRQTGCDDIMRQISDGDRRALRAKRVRGHLQSCSACSGFERSMRERRRTFALMPVVPFAAVSALLGGVLPAGLTATGAAAGATSGAVFTGSGGASGATTATGAGGAVAGGAAVIGGGASALGGAGVVVKCLAVCSAIAVAGAGAFATTHHGAAPARHADVDAPAAAAPARVHHASAKSVIAHLPAAITATAQPVTAPAPRPAQAATSAAATPAATPTAAKPARVVSIPSVVAPARRLPSTPSSTTTPTSSAPASGAPTQSAAPTPAAPAAQAIPASGAPSATAGGTSATDPGAAAHATPQNAIAALISAWTQKAMAAAGQAAEAAQSILPTGGATQPGTAQADLQSLFSKLMSGISK